MVTSPKPAPAYLHVYFSVLLATVYTPITKANNQVYWREATRADRNFRFFEW